MRKGRYFFSRSSTLAAFALASSFALAHGHGNGHGNGHRNNKQGDDGDATAYTFSDHARDMMRAWYDDHQGSLPPGLTKKDRLPPGLQKTARRTRYTASWLAEAHPAYPGGTGAAIDSSTA